MAQRFDNDVPRFTDIAAFGGLPTDLIHRRHFRSLEPRAAESWIKRRVYSGILQSAPLDARRVYYHLTKKGLDWLKRVHGVKVSRASARPMRPMAKVLRIAAAEFCTLGDKPPLSLLRPFQHADRFPDLAAYVAEGHADPLRQKLFYQYGDVIGFLAVDRGQDHFVMRKVQPKVLSLSRWDSLRSLMGKSGFRLTVLSPTDSRRAELTEQFESSPPAVWVGNHHPPTTPRIGASKSRQDFLKPAIPNVPQIHGVPHASCQPHRRSRSVP